MPVSRTLPPDQQDPALQQRGVASPGILPSPADPSHLNAGLYSTVRPHTPAAFLQGVKVTLRKDLANPRA